MNPLRTSQSEEREGEEEEEEELVDEQADYDDVFVPNNNANSFIMSLN